MRTGGEHFALHAVFLRPRALGQRFLLDQQLLFHALDVILQHAVNRRRLLLDPLLAVAAEIEVVDRLRQRGICAIALPLPASVGERREFCRLAVLIQKHARFGMRKDCVHLRA